MLLLVYKHQDAALLLVQAQQLQQLEKLVTIVENNLNTRMHYNRRSVVTVKVAVVVVVVCWHTCQKGPLKGLLCQRNGLGLL